MADYYRHFKGNVYVVLGMAIHSETKEPLVIYRRIGVSTADTYAQPHDVFHRYTGAGVKRFTKMSREEAEAFSARRTDRRLSRMERIEQREPGRWCWASMVTYAYYGDFGDLRSCQIDGICEKDTKECGTCYCGKFDWKDGKMVMNHREQAETNAQQIVSSEQTK